MRLEGAPPYDPSIGIRAAITLVTGLAALALAGPAAAEEIAARDGAGRTFTLDVRAAGVDTDWYVRTLRAADHSDEIEDVTIRIVTWEELRETCGRAAAGCYSRRRDGGLVVVPAGESSRTAHTLIHEYGHHIDASLHHGGIDEPNGTRSWWRVRGMAQLVQVRSVRRSYREGWSRSIAEIFAEDYAYMNVGGPYKISWLDPPNQATRQAIRADLGLGPPPPAGAKQESGLKPVLIAREETLAPGERASTTFGLLGPGRRVTFTAAIVGGGTESNLARLTVECDGRTIRTRTFTSPSSSASIDLPRLGPARCFATVTNGGDATERFRFTVRLAIRV
jgi:hypothetical protein